MTPVVGAMPTFDLGSAELPEEIELLVRFKQEPGFYNQGYEKVNSHRFAMFNFLDESCRNVPSQSGDYSLGKLFGDERFYKNECPPNFVGWTGYQLFSTLGLCKQENSVRRPFEKGFLLLVPVGNFHINGIGYRGASLFTADLETRLLAFPQLTFEEIARVDSKIIDDNFKSCLIGWRILKVTTVQPVSLPIERLDCWLHSGDRIYYKNAGGANLQIISREAVDDL